MKMRWAWTLGVLSILALLDAPAAMAQGYAGGPGVQMAPVYMPGQPAGYMAPGQPGLLPDAYGAYGTSAVGPDMSCTAAAQPGMSCTAAARPDMMMGDGCGYCGGTGCDACGGMFGHGDGRGLANGLLGDVFGLVAPYPDGGCAAPRWYDFSVDFMHLKREDAGRRVDFTSLGAGGPIVLSSTDLDFDNESSFRFSAMLQVGPGNNLEFTYFGLFFWDEEAIATSGNNDLFSVFSDFGTLPGVAGVGFAETDQSDLQLIDYESSFDSFEVNWRKRWVSPNCRYQGSWVCGVRYFKLDEDFNYFTQSPINASGSGIPSLNNNVNVHNNMTGFQLGGDLWMCILPGLRIGAEGKAGVFGNRIAVENTIEVNTGADPVVEDMVRNDVSFLGQADILATYRLNYNWTLRTGYQFLYVDGVALAVENFNPVRPSVLDPATPRVGTVNDNGDVFYHGWFVGAEFVW